MCAASPMDFMKKEGDEEYDDGGGWTHILHWYVRISVCIRKDQNKLYYPAIVQRMKIGSISIVSCTVVLVIQW